MPDFPDIIDTPTPAVPPSQIAWPDDLAMYQRWAANGVALPPAMTLRLLAYVGLFEQQFGEACRVCGCTDQFGCFEGCGWARPGLCTSCVGQAPAAPTIHHLSPASPEEIAS